MTDTDTQADRFEQMMWQAVDKLFEQHDGKLESMDGREQELVLIWRAEADIGNGGILQFVCNWGFPATEKTCSVLKKIGAVHSAMLIHRAAAALGKEIRHLQSEGKNLKEIWDITKHLDNKTASLLNSLDKQYWQDPDKLYLLGWQYYSGNPVQTAS
ncbi:DMP19 family protein [Neisseria cinerea]|uniref:DMP19 family protein n=1 Tax=Neisseria cinerea TaxID=483 RepID=UPI0027DF937F|nr:DUF4375 domain-containing protein [Neisseria cinerea]